MAYSESYHGEPKRLLIIAIDKSYSMEKHGIHELNSCLENFINNTKEDLSSFSSMELAVIAFNHTVDIICHPSCITDIDIPYITTEGSSNIAVGIEESIRIIKERTAFYKYTGDSYYKPWFVLITDSEDNINASILSDQIKKDVKNGVYQFLPVGVGNASMALLEQLKGSIMPVKLQDGKFNKFFHWLSSTVGNFSLSITPISLLNDLRPKIFISYKRVDQSKVIKIKETIEDRLNISCWFDANGIESDAQFANVIINAINECEIFLFMYSHAHTIIDDMDNDWTIREINFAQKKKKRIVFVNIDNTELTDWFEMMFGTKQQVDATNKDSINKLLLDISNWLDL